MKHAYSIFIFILIIASSCRFDGWQSMEGNGVSGKEERSVGSFRGVEVTGSMEVLVSIGNEHKVRIEADDNLIEYIETTVDGDILHIEPQEGYNLRPKNGIKLYITAPSLEKFYITGSGKITSTSKMVTNQAINTSVTGSGDIKLDVDAPEVQSEISGSGTIALSGATRVYKTEINGSGDIHSFELLSENTSVDISGSGNVDVFASKELDVDIAGAGDVRYKGSAKVTFDKIGGGHVKKVD